MYPRVPGHEVAGVIDEAGPGVRQWKCRRRDFVNCANLKVTGLSDDGGYQEYMIALVEAVARIPESLDPAEAAPLLCAGITTFNALRHSGALPGFESAMHELYGRTLARIAEGRASPRGVVPFLVMRENFIKRLYSQRTGYWKPDGDGIEVVAPREWAAVLELLAGGRDSAFADAARTLLGRGDHVLALKLVDLGLINHRESSTLAALRRRALDGLRARNQQLNPFKFIIYSEWAGADLQPVE